MIISHTVLMSGRGCAAEAGGRAGYQCSTKKTSFNQTRWDLFPRLARTNLSQSHSDGLVGTDYLLAFSAPSHFCLLILFLIIITDMRLKLSSKCLFS